MAMIRILRLLADLALVGLLLLGLTAAGLYWYISHDLPDVERLGEVRLETPLRIYSREGELLGEYGEKRRTPVALADVPEPLIQAVLAAEDDRFFEHPGVDWQGLVRAAIYLVRSGGKKTQGGSTITMQVARNFFLDRSKTYKRKLSEILLAFRIELNLDKEKILELYMNKIFLGKRAYGVAAAAEVYYGLPLQQLNLAQMAMLAALPQRPSEVNPLSNPERVLQRRGYVLRRMLELQYIGQAEYEEAMQQPISARLHPPPLQVEAPHLADMVLAEMLRRYGEEALTGGYKVYTSVQARLQHAANQAVRDNLQEYSRRHGYRGPEHRYQPAAGATEAQWSRVLRAHARIGKLYPALVVAVGERSAEVYLDGIGRLTIPWQGLAWAGAYLDHNRVGPLPQTAGEVVQTGDLVRIYEDAQGSWQLGQVPTVEGSLVVLDPMDGRLLALVGGFDYGRSKFNRATQALRQPGSSFKPFIFSAALHSGHTAASAFNDAPVVYEGVGNEGDAWRPKNYSGQTYGPTSMREALVHSRNLVTVRMLEAIGIPFTHAYLARFGFDTERLPRQLSLALGSGEVSPWQLARGYAVFANGGFLVEPYFIERIEDNEGNPLVRTEAPRACPREPCAQDNGDATEAETYAERVLDARNAWLITSMARDVIQRGTGRRARALQRSDLSGKTGTTNDQRDAWFAGYNSEMVTVAWVGFDRFLPLGGRETGSRAALPMWIKFMERALANRPEEVLPQPPGMVTMRIQAEAEQGGRAGSVSETFRIEYAPQQASRPRQPAIPGQDDANYQEQLF